MFDKISSVFVLLLLFAGGISAQSVSFKITKPPSHSLEFAVAFVVSLEITYPDNYSLKLKPFKSENYEILSSESSKPLLVNSKIKETFDFKIIPFTLGKSFFPAMNWILTDKKSGETKEIESPEIPLEISEMPKPKDLKGEIYDIYGICKPINYFLIGGLVLVALVFAVYFLFFGRRKCLSETTLADTRPPHIIALDELEKLLNCGLWQEGKIKFFYVRLSDILRDYIQRRFDVPAHKMTSFDLSRKLKNMIADKNIFLQIRNFFNSCDLVKFAKYMPGEQEKSKDIENLKTIIDLLHNWFIEQKLCSHPCSQTGVNSSGNPAGNAKQTNY